MEPAQATRSNHLPRHRHFRYRLEIRRLRVSTILDQIVANKWDEIRQARQRSPEPQLRKDLAEAPPVRDFYAALAPAGPIRLIAEVKKASPSKGVIRADFDPVAIAQVYQQHGAACISVLTDRPYFQGSLEYLRHIRRAVELPLLRKDFIVDPYQVLEARAAGADAILLIAECLDDSALRELYALVLELGMTPLVELFDAENLPRVVDLGARLIGINNRNLRTFEVDLNHALRLRRRIPEDRLVVAESGIRTREDALRLESEGIRAMLVGEALMASPDVGAAVARLLGRCA